MLEQHMNRTQLTMLNTVTAWGKTMTRNAKVPIVSVMT